VLAIETRIAQASYDEVKLRDIDANYHKMSYNDLVTDFPGIDWGNVFLASGFPAFDKIDVGQPEPIHEVEKILAEASLDDLKTYAEAKVISGAASQLSDDFRAEAFKLSGDDRRAARPSAVEACRVAGEWCAGEAIGKLYARNTSPRAPRTVCSTSSTTCRRHWPSASTRPPG
jgi:putative endopeptidase